MAAPTTPSMGDITTRCQIYPFISFTRLDIFLATEAAEHGRVS